MTAKVRLTVGSGIRQTSGMRTATGAPVGARVIPVLKYIAVADTHPVASSEYDVSWEGRDVGSVRNLGGRWQAVFPDLTTWPTLYSTRRAAGERLRQTAEGRRAA